jgi:hypothetical protein
LSSGSHSIHLSNSCLWATRVRIKDTSFTHIGIAYISQTLGTSATHNQGSNTLDHHTHLAAATLPTISSM